jgi:two-component system phosphate regulon sensor histidine kinase PhoR
MVVTAFVLFNFMEDRTISELKEADDLIAIGIEDYGEEYLEDVKASSVDRRITWIDEDGTVLFDNEADPSNMDNHSTREEFEEAVSSGSGSSIRHSDTMMVETVYYAEKLADGTVLRIATDQDSIWAVFAGLLKPAVIMFMFIVLLSLFLSMKVSQSILKPLNDLNLEDPEKNDTYDELKPLLDKIEAQQNVIREQQRTEMERAEAFRREYTANVSHELKTPLTSISGFAELMMDGSVPKSMVKEFSRSIYDEASRLITLVNDIIRLSQLDDKTVEYDWEDVDLYAVARENIRVLQASAGRKKVRIYLQGEKSEIRGVRRVLSDVIYNLVDNAIKYNRDGGSVEVSVMESADHEGVDLTVKDTGIGIPEKDIDRVFERFYRVDKSHSKAVGGTGLGLSIVKHGVSIHHAKLDIHSTVGMGTTISIHFPKDARNVDEENEIKNDDSEKEELNPA